MLQISPPSVVRESQPPDVPLLSLTHFSRPPFVTFGNVRTGSAHSVQLLLYNPNQEVAEVRVFNLPERKGFSVRERETTIQPDGTVPVTITWTPLEEGGVRELITFIVNNVVKHQAVLLGRAELPPKKKKNLWNNTKKRTAPAGPKRKESGIKSVNSRTLHLTHKSIHGKYGRDRSPLHSCENLILTENCTSPGLQTRLSTESKTPALEVSPLATKLQDYTPGSLRRSKTYSVLCTTEYKETTSRTQTDLHIEEKWTFSDKMCKRLSVSPINTACSDPQRVTCTPNIFREYAVHTTLSPDTFFKAQLQSKTESQTHVSFSTAESSYCSAKGSLSVSSSSTHSPASILVSRQLMPQRKILSPNSFINNSSVPEECFESAPHTPILSPDQFVRDNFLASQSVSLLNESKLSMSLQTTSLNTSKHLQPLVAEGEVQTLQSINDSVEQESLNKSPEAEVPIDSRLTYCVKKKRRQLIQPPSEGNNVTTALKKPPVASATVIKVKAGGQMEKPDRPQLKSRRCLQNTHFESENTVPSRIIFQDLPVIRLSNSTGSSEEEPNGSVKSACCGRKRRSEEILGNADITVTTKVTLEAAKLVTNEFDSMTPTKRIHLFKPAAAPPVSDLQRLSQRKKTVSLALKSSGKSQKAQLAASKAKPSSVKMSQTDLAFPPKRSSAVTFKNSKRIVAVPQSQLTFVKPSKTVIPRHPMPFASKNMFYDERWMAKQERGFTWWLNFILTPDDFAVKTGSVKVNAASLILGEESCHRVSVPKAPTKEEVSLRAYTARCRLNRLRRAACRLFTSEAVVRAIRRLEVEIEARRLLVRKDRHLWKDIGERQKILNWLLSYNPLWLRVGLETIFGELISLENNSDITGLALFILNRLLWNPDIAVEYRHPTVPHLYRDGHEDALSKFTLKKLLLLVFFLDLAKQSRLIDHDPCLFWKDAEFKTSKDLLLAFSRDFLSGEGDLSRHLSYLGLPVSHSQTHLDEFDFAVSNLAVDLQCGVRLVRTMELLTQDWSLSKKLRVPAISRLQKMHNIEVALQVLKDSGVQLKDERGVAITSKDIVDRHRERTLALLWKIVFAFQVDVLLNVQQLKEEIKFLKQSYSTQKKLAALRSYSHLTTARKRDSDHFEPENYSECVLLLMAWVNSVCAFYSAKVENFTVSFSDGRVFCYLINHYHPSYVPMNSVCQRTTLTVECSPRGAVGLNSSSDSDSSVDMWPGIYDQGVGTSDLCKELLENEKMNFSLVNAAVSNLGGIPAMIHHSDMSNTIPDEKVVIAYLSFLCARLLNLRKEARAARVIQAAWRNYRLRTEEQLLEKKHKAACTIQAAAIRFLFRRRQLKRALSAIVIQKHWRRRMAQKLAAELKAHRWRGIQERAAVRIQCVWRSYLARNYFCTLRRSVILIQARVRTKMAVSAYTRLVCATLTIQRCLRSWLLAKKIRQQYLQLKAASAVIQSAYKQWKRRKLRRQTHAVQLLQRVYRRWRARRQALQTAAAIKIQSCYRMYRERQRYLAVKCHIIKIQAWFRCRRDQRAFETKKKHALILQKYYRAYKQGCLERERFLQKRHAAVSLQASYRGLVDRRLYRQLKAAILIQSLWRMHQQRKRFECMRQLIILLQANVRRYQQMTRYRNMKRAACIIQCRYRAYVATKNAMYVYKRVCNAVTVLQSAFRKFQARKNALKHNSAIKIQSFYRAHVVRKRFLAMKAAAIKIQSVIKMRYQLCHYRALRVASIYVQRQFRANRLMQQEKAAYMKLHSVCIKLQAAVRGHVVRNQIQLWHNAAMIIQASYRMKKQKKQYLLMRKAAVRIQCRYRAHKERLHHREKYLMLKQAAVRLQATYKGYSVRKILRNQHAAARCIQTAFRSYIARCRYEQIKQSVVKIQRWYRAHVSGKHEREKFLKTTRGIIAAQAAYRGWKARQLIQKRHKAALRIQSIFRKFAAQKKLQAMRTAAVTIQQQYRAILVGRRARRQFLDLHEKSKRIQAVWRGWLVRKAIRQQQKAAILIQSYYKMHIHHTRYMALKGASVVIQMHFRALKAGLTQRTCYLKIKAAVVVLQAAYRGKMIRKQIQDLHKAAAKIQTTYRTFIVRKQFLALRTATIVIQRRYRAVISCEIQQTEYKRLRNTAVVLQSVYRGVKVRREISRMHKSAVIIQAWFRMQSMRIKYKTMKLSAGIIQQRCRVWLESRRVRSRYLEIKRAACRLQAVWRGRKTRESIRRLHKAATIIQSHYQMLKQKRSYNALKEATKKMQLRYQASKERNKHVYQYVSLRNAALCIQAAFRGMKVRQELQAKHKAATFIQRKFKTVLARRSFVTLKKAVVSIQRRFRMLRNAKRQRQECIKLREAAVAVQAAYRGLRARRMVKRMHASAAVIQAAYRKHKAVVAYQAMRHASILLQRQYRAYKMAKYERNIYLKKRHAAVVIQSAYLKLRCRQKLHKMNQAAYKIQATFKMHLCRCRYLKVRWAVLVIQHRYRANKQSDFEVLRYSIMKNAACCIQSFYRGWIVRKEQKQMTESAIVIQKNIRTYQAQSYYLSLRSAIVAIQRCYRATVLRRTQYHQNQLLLRATVCIQASYRGFIVRKELAQKHRMATKIQSAFRMYRAHVKYKAMQLAARRIQAWYRQTSQCRRIRAAYLKLRDSTVAIQAAYRGISARKKVTFLHVAATVIQSYYRTYRQQKCYRRLLQATCTIQQRYRAKKSGDVDRFHYQKIRKVTVLLQAAARGMRTRKELRKMHQSAVMIQRHFKTVMERKQFLKLRLATVCLQRKYRASVVSRSQRQQFLSLRKAAICIQATYRGFKEREKLRERHRAATKIQAMYRMHKLRTSYKVLKQAATHIQCWYRGYRIARRERENYLVLQKAAILIQASYRGTKTRKNLQAMHSAANVIKSTYKMYKQRKYYKDLHMAVRIAQQRFRANRTRDRIHQQYAVIRKAVLCIQSAFRAMKARREAKRNAAAVVIQTAWLMHKDRKMFVKMKSAAVIVQAAFRGHRVRKQCKQMHESARLIQKWYRRCHAAAEQRAQYLSMRRAAVTLQSAYRGMMARKLAQRARAARKLQSLIRMAACRNKFLQLRAATIKLQSYYRMCRARRLFNMQKEAAVILQRLYRAHVAMKHQRATYLQIQRRIVCIQAAVRGHQERRRLQKMQSSAIRMQAVWRGLIQRRAFLRYRASALIIQQRYRAWCLQKLQRWEYLKQIKAAVVLQAVYRGFQARKIVRRERAAHIIQSWYRCYKARKNYTALLQAVQTVQRHIRAKRERTRFLEVRMAAVRIQRRWREVRSTRFYRLMFLQKRTAALKIQSVLRGCVARRKIFRMHRAATVIQATYRRFWYRRHFLRLKGATVVLQKRFRGILEGRRQRFHFLHKRSAVIWLQACARGWLVRNKIVRLKREQFLLRFVTVLRYHLSAIIIQRRFRIHLTLRRAQQQIHNVICIQRWIRTKLQRRKFLADRQRIVALQRTVRLRLHHRNDAARKIQIFMRDLLLRRRQARVMQGIVKIQALWRGYTWRKTHDTKVLQGLRLRLQKANREAKEQDKLYYRMSLALEYLLSFKDLSYILEALRHLEVATRLSSVCCENMAQSRAVKVIFTLIRSCNRSIPCMEVIKLSVQVLLNLSKYEKTMQAVYEAENSVDVLLNLMQIYREKAGDKVSDKGGSIFTKTCCLMAILAKDTQRARDIRSIPKCLDRIFSIYRLTSRKHKLDAERILYQQRINAPTGVSSVLRSTPIRTKVVSRIKPDWVLNKDNMREIVDPLIAIRMVMETLGAVASNFT